MDIQINQAEWTLNCIDGTIMGHESLKTLKSFIPDLEITPEQEARHDEIIEELKILREKVVQAGDDEKTQKALWTEVSTLLSEWNKI